jgi:hypothetical protein
MASSALRQVFGNVSDLRFLISALLIVSGGFAQRCALIVPCIDHESIQGLIHVVREHGPLRLKPTTGGDSASGMGGPLVARSCAAQNCWSSLDWRVMAWLLWPRAGHWLE